MVKVYTYLLSYGKKSTILDDNFHFSEYFSTFLVTILFM